MGNPTFTASDALNTTTKLRTLLGLRPEEFSAQAFVGMISDEIEKLRAANYDDAGIAALISEFTGKPMTSSLIAEYHAPREGRGRAD